MADTENFNKSFWNFKAYEENEWFKKLTITLICLGIVYVFLHFFTTKWFPQSEYEYKKLDKEQMQQINRIYFDTPIVDSTKISKSEELTNTDDTAKIDSIDSVNSVKKQMLANDTIDVMSGNRYKKYWDDDSCNCTECTKTEKVMCYLWNDFNHKIDTSQMNTIYQYLNCATPVEATGFLSNTRLQVKSYFWLTGPLVYWEIIFWTWFGVICSVLYNLGIVSKNSTTDPTDPTTYFDSSEVPSQVAKFFYAPACTLAIVLGYNFFSSDNIVDISSSKGVLVFAFIGGFYSSRLVAFLDKLKELLLPVSSTSGTARDTPPLKNVVVQLQLDETVADLWDALQTDLHLLKVTLQKENSTQQAIALNIDKNQWPLFIFDFVKQGTYIVQALWSTKKDDGVINLKAEQKIEMKDADQSVTLKLTLTS